MKFSIIARLAGLAAASIFTAAAQATPALNTANIASLNGWSTAGDVAVSQTGTLGLVLNETSLLLGTAAATVHEDDAPAAAGAYNISLNNPVAAGSGLETSVGLTPGALDDNTNLHYPMEGSSAWKDFSVLAGDTLQINWQLFARPDTGTGSPLPDTAWLVWTQGANTQVIKLADVLSAAMGTSADPHGWLSTGLQQHTVNATHNGTARLGFVVADMDSFDTTSVLAVSNVVQASAVPEPSTVLLVLAGLVMMIYMSRRQSARRKEG
jgi:PEP-CTERM motif